MMKKILSLITVILLTCNVFAQTTCTLTWDNTEREYLEYVPTSHTGDEPAALLLILHGLGDNMSNAFTSFQFKNIADEHNWILLVPQALNATLPMVGSFGTCWNAGITTTVPYLGAISLNADVDDAGFLNKMIDNTLDKYNINPYNIFCTGFSMGGFMTNRMGIEHGDRFNAIASVSGTIGSAMDTVSPVCTALNTLHIHGTSDSTVTYNEANIVMMGMSAKLGLGAEATVKFWRDFNDCDTTPVFTQYDDNASDGLTFAQYLYNSNSKGTKTAFIKVQGGDHSWYSTPTNDIDYTTEIYKFFASCLVPNAVKENQSTQVSVFPNPVSDVLRISFDTENSNDLKTIYLYDSYGRMIEQKNVSAANTSLDLSTLPAGFYFLQILQNNNVNYYQKIIKQ